MISIYSASNYQTYLRHWIDSHSETRGLKSRMAEAAECQGSHLTRVLKEEVHLTPDQAFDLAQFMKLGESESRYFLRLVDRDRASSARLRRQIQSELDQMRTEHENLSRRFREDRLGDREREMIYYANWWWSAVHIATTIPKLRSPSAIAKRLGLSEENVRDYLEQLEAFGLVKRHGETWTTTRDFVHLPKTSPMNSVQHRNWRERAIQDSTDANRDSVHYTVVQTVSARDYERIKELIFESIGRYREIADPSTEEELVCFTCDFFRV